MMKEGKIIKMKTTQEELENVLTAIGSHFAEFIDPNSDKYSVVNFGKAARRLKEEFIAEVCGNESVFIPGYEPENGIAVLVNGNDLAEKGYRQLESGLVVSEFVARYSELPNKKYIPQKEMTMFL